MFRKRRRRKKLGKVIYKNEELVGTFLTNNNIPFEKICIKANNRKYYPDYFIRDLNLLIEYNGAQHYKPVRFGNIPLVQAKINLEKQKLRDEQLRVHCQKYGINLLEIDGRKYKGNAIGIFLNNYLTNILNIVY